MLAPSMLGCGNGLIEVGTCSKCSKYFDTSNMTWRVTAPPNLFFLLPFEKKTYIAQAYQFSMKTSDLEAIALSTGLNGVGNLFKMH